MSLSRLCRIGAATWAIYIHVDLAHAWRHATRGGTPGAERWVVPLDQDGRSPCKGRGVLGFIATEGYSSNQRDRVWWVIAHDKLCQ